VRVDVVRRRGRGAALVEEESPLDALFEEGTEAPSSVVLSSHAAAILTSVITVLLWLLVAAGAVGGVAAWLLRPNGKASASPVAVRSPVGPTGWAQEYLITFLRTGEGQEDQLRAFGVDVPVLDKVTPTSSPPAVSTPLRAAETAPGYWTVTLAVDAPVAGGRSDGGGTPACYQVSLLARGDAAAGGTGAPGAPVGYAVTRLPGRIACPAALAGTAQLAYGAAEPDLGDPVDDVVRRFLAALLTGNGEISRYTSPAAAIAPVVPAPYTAVELMTLARGTSAQQPGTAVTAAPTDGQRLRVLATVRVSGPSGVQMLTYPLVLSARAGRWEVAALSGAPTLDASHLPRAAPAATPTEASTLLLTPPTTQPATPEGPSATPSGPLSTP
jgi:hypothetical protein